MAQGSLVQACEKVNASLMHCTPVRMTAEYLQVPPLAVCVALGLFAVGFVLYGFGGGFVCSIAGLAYPALESFKALEVKDHAEVQFWLIYWVVFSSLSVIECVTYYILSWIPFYFPLKLGLLLWLFLPSTRGAETLYHIAVSPLLHRNKDHIDVAIKTGSKELKRSLSGLPQVIGTGALIAGTGGVQTVRTLTRHLTASIALNSNSGEALLEKGEESSPPVASVSFAPAAEYPVFGAKEE